MNKNQSQHVVDSFACGLRSLPLTLAPLPFETIRGSTNRRIRPQLVGRVGKLIAKFANRRKIQKDSYERSQTEKTR